MTTKNLNLLPLDGRQEVKRRKKTRKKTKVKEEAAAINKFISLNQRCLHPFNLRSILMFTFHPKNTPKPNKSLKGAL